MNFILHSEILVKPEAMLQYKAKEHFARIQLQNVEMSKEQAIFLTLLCAVLSTIARKVEFLCLSAIRIPFGHPKSRMLPN